MARPGLSLGKGIFCENWLSLALSMVLFLNGSPMYRIKMATPCISLEGQEVSDNG